MKSVFPNSILLFCLLLLADISAIRAQNGDKGVTTQTRTVSNFSGITLNVPADLELSQGENFSVRLEGNKNEVDQVITEQKGGQLIIRYKENDWKSGADHSLRIVVSLPKIEGLEVNGSGKIITITDLETADLTLEVNGSGNIKTKTIKADNISATVNGSGILWISGNSRSLRLDVNGSGKIDAESLVCEKAKAGITGSGNILLGNANAIDALITGSGNIYYSGKSTNVKKSVTGSGNVIQQ